MNNKPPNINTSQNSPKINSLSMASLSLNSLTDLLSQNFETNLIYFQSKTQKPQTPLPESTIIQKQTQKIDLMEEKKDGIEEKIDHIEEKIDLFEEKNKNNSEDPKEITMNIENVDLIEETNQNNSQEIHSEAKEIPMNEEKIDNSSGTNSHSKDITVNDLKNTMVIEESKQNPSPISSVNKEDYAAITNFIEKNDSYDSNSNEVSVEIEENAPHPQTDKKILDTFCEKAAQIVNKYKKEKMVPFPGFNYSLLEDLIIFKETLNQRAFFKTISSNIILQARTAQSVKDRYRIFVKKLEIADIKKIQKFLEHNSNLDFRKYCLVFEGSKNSKVFKEISGMNMKGRNIVKAEVQISSHSDGGFGEDLFEFDGEEKNIENSRGFLDDNENRNKKKRDENLEKPQSNRKQLEDVFNKIYEKTNPTSNRTNYLNLSSAENRQYLDSSVEKQKNTSFENKNNEIIDLPNEEYKQNIDSSIEKLKNISPESKGNEISKTFHSKNPQNTSSLVEKLKTRPFDQKNNETFNVVNSENLQNKDFIIDKFKSKSIDPKSNETANLINAENQQNKGSSLEQTNNRHINNSFHKIFHKANNFVYNPNKTLNLSDLHNEEHNLKSQNFAFKEDNLSKKQSSMKKASKTEGIKRKESPTTITFMKNQRKILLCPHKSEFFFKSLLENISNKFKNFDINEELPSNNFLLMKNLEKAENRSVILINIQYPEKTYQKISEINQIYKKKIPEIIDLLESLNGNVKDLETFLDNNEKNVALIWSLEEDQVLKGLNSKDSSYFRLLVKYKGIEKMKERMKYKGIVLPFEF